MMERRSKLRNSAGELMALGVVGCVLWCFLQLSAPARQRSENILSPFLPTPFAIVTRMLEMAKVRPSDRLYDLGSGDGRIVIMAAQRFGAQAVGVELDPKLFRESSQRIEQLGLQKRARIIYGDLFDVNLHPASVVTLYLLPSVNERIEAKLDKELRSGTRVVAHDFPLNGWTPEKIEQLRDASGAEHKIYLYVRP